MSPDVSSAALRLFSQNRAIVAMMKTGVGMITVVVLTTAQAPIALTTAQAPIALTTAQAPIALTTAQAPIARPAVDFKGRLYRAVFVPGPDTLSSGDLAQVADPLRARLSRFLVRRTAFTSIYKGTPNDVVAVARDAKRRAVERAIVSLIEVDGIEQRAADFVTAAPIAYEWEGMPDGPLAESAFAEQLLQKEPSTPLAPFLYLFVAQRQRAAAEAAELEQNAAVTQAATAKAREFLKKARGASDSIFGLVADDLERVPFVYVRKKASGN
jgi:hypothetical protein